MSIGVITGKFRSSARSVLPLLLLSLLLAGCVSMRPDSWRPYPQMAKSLRRPFDMALEIKSQMRLQMDANRMGFRPNLAGNIRPAFIGYTMAYDNTSFTSSSYGYHTIRDVFDTTYGPVVITKDSTFLHGELDLIFAKGLRNFFLVEPDKRDRVLTGDYFTFNIRTPAKQESTLRIPAEMARRYVKYIEGGKYEEATATQLAEAIYESMEGAY
jgi:hypothetical protein